MKTAKNHYIAPESEVFNVTIEVSFLESGNDGYGSDNAAGQSFTRRTYDEEF